MHIYVATDNDVPTTWIVKSKDLKRFREEFYWIDDTQIRKYSVNNLHQICCAVCGVAGMYTGDIYE
tara:strand:+ start:274 stop:471 length:198 start_codon:yes stop_codon:yes gene_type:complete